MVWHPSFIFKLLARHWVKLGFRFGLVLAHNVYKRAQYFSPSLSHFCKPTDLLLSLQLLLELFYSNHTFAIPPEADVNGSSHRQKRSRSHSLYLPPAIFLALYKLFINISIYLYKLRLSPAWCFYVSLPTGLQLSFSEWLLIFRMCEL